MSYELPPGWRPDKPFNYKDNNREILRQYAEGVAATLARDVTTEVTVVEFKEVDHGRS